MYNKSNIFLIDIDGVACEHAKAICKWVNEKYKINSKVEDVTSWDHNFGPITFVDAVEICYPDKNFILSMEVTHGFHEFLKQLSKVMTAKFVSARKKYCHNATRLWVKEKFGELDVCFVKSKTEVDFDYIVDDSPEEIIAVAGEGKECFLFSQPWNNNKATKDKLKKFNQIHFVDSFTDIIHFLSNEM